MNSIAENVLNKFTEKFKQQPALYFSPGRINLIGEHVDYNSGYVMPAAINKGIYFALAANNTGIINFYAADFAENYSVALTDIKKADGWKNYVLGVVNEFLLLGKPVAGFNCVFSGDIPQGGGMSSSAAVEGGLAFAINDVFAFELNKKELALLCQRAEHNYPGVKCGIMDMYANLHGKKDNVILLDCESITHEYFPLQLDGYKIVLLNSKVHHSLASGEYNVRRQYCEEGLMILQKQTGMKSFRQMAGAAVVVNYKNLMKPEVYNCCKYAVEEIERTKQAAVLLKQNNLTEFGRLMFATHAGLRELYKVSCAELDFLVEKAQEDENIIGARLMGGGFGGCTINIVKEKAVNNFINNTANAYQKAFNVLPEAYVIEIANGTNKLNYQHSITIIQN